MKLIAVYDEYNHNYLKPYLATCIQPRHPVPNHGCRIVLEEEECETTSYSDAIDKNR